MDDFKVIITKHTDIEEAHSCIESTMGAEFVAKSTLKQIYSWEHSITRSQIFSVQLINIPTFVSVHLVRHVTTTPFVRSKRIDRGGDGTEDRFTPVNHRLIANAESILHIARKRLCYKASKETRDVVLALREEMKSIDPDLAYYMVPNCIYRGFICPEPKPCGNYKVRRFKGIEDEEIAKIKR
ncbi:MAG: hypothetical protein WC055_00550 [Melioribacteraceae bacterium]